MKFFVYLVKLCSLPDMVLIVNFVKHTSNILIFHVLTVAICITRNHCLFYFIGNTTFCKSKNDTLCGTGYLSKIMQVLIHWIRINYAFGNTTVCKSKNDTLCGTGYLSKIMQVLIHWIRINLFSSIF